MIPVNEILIALKLLNAVNNHIQLDGTSGLVYARRGLSDFWALMFGNKTKGLIRLDSKEEAAFKAMNFCKKKDKETLLRVYACVYLLYANYKIDRAAQVGGTLLGVFGKEVFPHIHDRELEFAFGMKPWELNTVVEEFKENPEINRWISS